MGSEIAQTTCSCGRNLIAWAYLAADGDLLFTGGSKILVGNGDLQRRAALVCETCDNVRRFPRFGHSEVN